METSDSGTERAESNPRPADLAPKDKSAAFKSLRRGKLSYCTRKMNDIKEMMGDGSGVDEVAKNVAVAFKGALREFIESHAAVQTLLTEEVRKHETQDWYEPKMADFDAFLSDVDMWKQSQLNSPFPQAAHAQIKRLSGSNQLDPQCLLSSHDSVSRVSKGKSKSSSLSSEKTRAAAERAALSARAGALKKKHELDMQKFQLEAQLESLELEADIAATDAKLQVLEDQERLTAAGATGMQRSMQAMTENIPAGQTEPEKLHAFGVIRPDGRPSLLEAEVLPDTSLQTADGYDVSHVRRIDFAPIEPGAIPKTPLQAILQAYPDHLTRGTGREQPAAGAHKVIPDGRGQSTPQGNITHNFDITAITQRQTELADLLVMQQRQASLPKRVITVFDGDPLTYRFFMQAFRYNIEDKTDSNEDRLYFLEQYTAGEPKRLVQSCFHMNAAAGYAEAKRLLSYHYGDNFKIMSAYIEGALNWEPIRTEDGKALHGYAVYLRSCGNAIKDLPNMSELDLPSNMKQLVLKLPFKLREKWRSTAPRAQGPEPQTTNLPLCL